MESAGFNDQTWLDHDGHPHTEALRMTERYRRRDFGHLEVDVTFSDPAAYTKPWTVAVRAELAADTELLEWVCNEKGGGLEHWVGKASDEKKSRSEGRRRDSGEVCRHLRGAGAALEPHAGPPRGSRSRSAGETLLADMDGRGKVPLTASSPTTFSGLYGLGVEFIQDGAGGLFVKHVSGNYRFARK